MHICTYVHTYKSCFNCETSIIHTYVRSYSLWERVQGGQVQKLPCDDTSTNPVLVFNINRPTVLMTVPLNLLNLRYVCN